MTIDDLKYEQLLGRPFTGIGKSDCLALTREFFATNFGIEIPNFARPHDWSSDELDLIGPLGEKAGFEQITRWRPADLRPGDILAVCVGERNPNHLANYVGNSKIVHHLFGRMSNVEELRDFWFNHTAFILRHPDVPDLRPVYPDVDLMDLINARKAAPTQ